METDSPSTRAILADLSSNRKYFFLVRAQNRFGVGTPSKISEGLFLARKQSQFVQEIRFPQTEFCKGSLKSFHE